MKKLLIIGIAFLAIQVSAQETKENKRNDMRKERMEQMKNMTPEERAEMATTRMSKALDLTEAQQEKVKALHLKQVEKRKNIIAERKAMTESAEREKPSKEEMQALRAERMKAREEMTTELKAILTDAQFEKWQSQQEMMRERGEKMRKRRDTEGKK